MKITHILFLPHIGTLYEHTDTPADQYVASMDACCNFSSLLSAVLLCPNSSSLLFSNPPNGLSLDAACSCSSLLSVLSLYCFFSYFVILVFTAAYFTSSFT